MVSMILVSLLSLGITEARRMQINETARSGGYLECPSACQECCVDKNWFGVPEGDDFKCIAKLPFDSLQADTMAQLFKGRTVDPPERRTYAKEQAKIDIEYTAAEKAAKSWVELNDAPCSKYSQCCCDDKEDWTEQKCFPMDVTAETTTGESTRQTTEKFLRQNQTYPNKKSKCVDPSLTALFYQPSRDQPATDAGCCTKVANIAEEERYICGCSESSRRYCRRTVYHIGCVEWENLYYCTGNGGLTQSGQHYKRISSETGLCLGDQSSLERLVHTYGWETMQKAKDALNNLKLKDGKCPAGYTPSVAGEKCECDVACGNGY